MEKKTLKSILVVSALSLLVGYGVGRHYENTTLEKNHSIEKKMLNLEQDSIQTLYDSLNTNYLNIPEPIRSVYLNK